MTSTEPSHPVQAQASDASSAQGKKKKKEWSLKAFTSKRHQAPSSPIPNTPVDSAMDIQNSGKSSKERTKAIAINAVSSDEGHIGAVTGMNEPVNLNPPRVPRSFITTLPYAVISFPNVLIRRARGHSYHASWSFRDEYVVNLLRFTLGTPRYGHWRFLIMLAGMLGRTRIPISLVVEETSNNLAQYTFTAYQFTLRRPNLGETAASNIILGESTATSTTINSPDMPPSQKDPWVILYMHGGGYSSGRPMMHAVVYKYLLNNLQKKHGINQVRLVALKYPLAPEHPYPAAIDTAIKCLTWLREAEGIPMDRVILGGDSAGGGLCMAVLQRIKARYGDGSEMFPGHAFVISPWVQLSDQVPSYVNRMNARTDYLVPRLLKPFVNAYMRDGKTGELIAPLDHPQVSPGTADWSGVPTRILVTVGGKEIFYRSIVEFVDLASQGGMEARLISDPDMPHVYPTLMDFFPKNARRTLDEIVDWLAEVIEPVEKEKHQEEKETGSTGGKVDREDTRSLDTESDRIEVAKPLREEVPKSSGNGEASMPLREGDMAESM
ncbi:Alpha/Beta hydrolase protein [Piptocephalis cylindrospora]|uniref:Alpha/Beta hydrolase protein n=1 Tax=Piptocephalis cylindrospora TaxID=1907219 RepID=A0A4P9YB59_9FUNG|nr:Alpha/Beta hydrolase protein [Piptocephalis cylindrospora]|eukprot:RKP15360.1 Alpha/Beta hydrolase protein [Piptocephalis cylindrospora]